MEGKKPHRWGQSLGRCGFTLIEVSIVVSVLSILAGIAVPNYLRAAERSKRGSCVSNQRNLAFATTLFCSDTGFQDGTVSALDLHDAGYCSDENADCPDSQVLDLDDYDITVVDGKVEGVECLIGGEDHLLSF